MATDDAWGRALRTAKRRYEQAHDTDLTYKEMGRRLGELLGRDPLPHPTVRSWFVDGQEPETFRVVRALATMLETTPGELIAEVNHDVPPSAADDETGEGGAGNGVKPKLPVAPPTPSRPGYVTPTVANVPLQRSVEGKDKPVKKGKRRDDADKKHGRTGT